MALHPKAGQKADPRELTNIPKLMADYFTIRPDMSDPACHVSFGTSGHRGVSSFYASMACIPSFRQD